MSQRAESGERNIRSAVGDFGLGDQKTLHILPGACGVGAKNRQRHPCGTGDSDGTLLPTYGSWRGQSASAAPSEGVHLPPRRSSWGHAGVSQEAAGALQGFSLQKGGWFEPFITHGSPSPSPSPPRVPTRRSVFPRPPPMLRPPFQRPTWGGQPPEPTPMSDPAPLVRPWDAMTASLSSLLKAPPPAPTPVPLLPAHPSPSLSLSFRRDEELRASVSVVGKDRVPTTRNSLEHSHVPDCARRRIRRHGVQPHKHFSILSLLLAPDAAKGATRQPVGPSAA